jgi:hypothetical protein
MFNQELPAQQGVAPAEAASGPADQAWQELAACAETANPDLFTSPNPIDQAAAKKYCGRCAVQTECLTDAIAKNMKFCIRGGLTEEERQALGQ